VPGGEHWRCLIDTNIPERSDEPLFAFGDTYQVTGRSLLMFVLQDGSRAAPAE
jgi:glycogen operon protein